MRICSGSLNSVGYKTRAILGCRDNRSAMRSAFLLDRFMRSATVGNRPSSIQHSSGCRMFPNRLRLLRILRISSGSAAMAAPPIISLNPERYLVAEYIEISAPSASGCWNAGPISVLSTITIGFLLNPRAVSAASLMPVMMMVGLAGVSIKTTARFFALRIASSISWVAPAGTGMPAMPRVERKS